MDTPTSVTMIAVSTATPSSQKTNGNHSDVSKTVTIVDSSTSIDATNGDATTTDKSKNEFGENTPPNENAEKSNTLKKRVSSSKTPNRTREMTKAKRVRFFRNGDKFWTGILVAVSNERYK